MDTNPRSRRSCLTVPGSRPRMLAKAQDLPVDEVVIDLEDAVVPANKANAREHVVAALNNGVWDGKTVAVRVNDWSTPWTFKDLVEVVESAGNNVDCLVLPKVDHPEQIIALDLVLSQVERAAGISNGRLGLEAQIESAAGVINVNAIAQASPRLEALIFGPVDYAASIGAASVHSAGAEHARAAMLIASRAHGLHAIDGPYLTIHDLEGLSASAQVRSDQGYDGTWVVHPSHIDIANSAFTPSQEEYDRAERIIAGYERHTSPDGDQCGAALLDGEMIDEASRKHAMAIAANGRAAGMTSPSIT